MGGGAPVPPPNYVVLNVTFTEPYTQYTQPKQSMSIIGGYVARNMQNVAAIQTNAAQLGEGNANIACELGRLHLVQPDQFVGGDDPTTSKGTTIKIINTNNRQRIRKKKEL
jgi:hypothetical protein